MRLIFIQTKFWLKSDSETLHYFWAWSKRNLDDANIICSMWNRGWGELIHTKFWGQPLHHALDVTWHTTQFKRPHRFICMREWPQSGLHWLTLMTQGSCVLWLHQSKKSSQVNQHNMWAWWEMCSCWSGSKTTHKICFHYCLMCQLLPFSFYISKLL